MEGLYLEVFVLLDVATLPVMLLLLLLLFFLQHCHSSLNVATTSLLPLLLLWIDVATPLFFRSSSMLLRPH